MNIKEFFPEPVQEEIINPTFEEELSEEFEQFCKPKRVIKIDESKLHIEDPVESKLAHEFLQFNRNDTLDTLVKKMYELDQRLFDDYLIEDVHQIAMYINNVQSKIMYNESDLNILITEILSEDGRIVQGVNTTQDVSVDEIKIQAQKMGFNVTKGGVPAHLTPNGVHPTPLIFETRNLKELNLRSYLNKYYEAYNIEKLSHRGVSGLTRLNLYEDVNIKSFIDYFRSLGLPKDYKIKIGDYFSVLAFEFLFAHNEIEAFGFENPKKVTEIHKNPNGTINYIKFEDGDRYPRITPAIYDGKPVTYAAYFNSQDKVQSAKTALSLKLPIDWEIIYNVEESVNESLLTEARHNSVILVDFQPAYYSEDFGYIEAIENAIEYINAKQPHVTCFFNGDDISEDRAPDVAQHYAEMGANEDLVYDFDFKEKVYAFLRGWMEDGHNVDEDIIIKVIRYLVTNRLNDSREIEEEVFRELVGDDWFEELYDSDNIYIPDVSIGDLKALSGSLLGGGGRHECLKEMQLFMNAFNIRYKLVDSWIYG